MRQFIKQIFCKHNFVFHRNIHGDEINLTGGRSWWYCSKCSKMIVKQEYVTNGQQDKD